MSNGGKDTDMAGFVLEIESLVSAVEAFGTAAAEERARLLDRIRDCLGKLEEFDKASRAALEASSQKASEGTSTPAEVEEEAWVSRELESATAKGLLPRILSLQHYLTDTPEADDPEAYKLVQKAINVAFGYAGGYQDLREQLIRLAAKENAASKVLRARPVKGKIDHRALTREIIARFPKILAALAK